MQELRFIVNIFLLEMALQLIPNHLYQCLTFAFAFGLLVEVYLLTINISRNFNSPKDSHTLRACVILRGRRQHYGNELKRPCGANIKFFTSEKH